MLDLDTFLETYDIAGSIVLLAGSRNVAPMDQQKLRDLGKLLAKRSKQIVFRSGNADGADSFFIHGVGEVDPSRIEIIVPDPKHRPKNRVAYASFSLDQVDLLQEPNLVEQAKRTTGARYGIERYLGGETSGGKIVSAKYILRSTLMVTGSQQLNPANFAIFYIDFSSDKLGGTGHTIKVCEQMNVEHIDQCTWFSWLD